MSTMLFCKIALLGMLSFTSASNDACDSDAPSLLHVRTDVGTASQKQSVAEDSLSRLRIADHLLAMRGDRSSQTPQLEALFRDLELAVKVGSPGEALEGHTESGGELWEQTDHYDTWATSGTNHTVCETGFNAGHSALRFLAQSRARLFEFDLGAHNYAKVAAQFLDSRFPGRLTNVWGDSTVTLPQFHADHKDIQCDILIVDGGHSYEVAMADLENMQKMAAPVHVLTIDDTPCDGGWCEGPTKAWKELVQLGCVNETEVVGMGGSRGFSVGHYTSCDRWA